MHHPAEPTNTVAHNCTTTFYVKACFLHQQINLSWYTITQHTSVTIKKMSLPLMDRNGTVIRRLQYMLIIDTQLQWSDVKESDGHFVLFYSHSKLLFQLQTALSLASYQPFYPNKHCWWYQKVRQTHNILIYFIRICVSFR